MSTKGLRIRIGPCRGQAPGEMLRKLTDNVKPLRIGCLGNRPAWPRQQTVLGLDGGATNVGQGRASQAAGGISFSKFSTLRSSPLDRSTMISLAEHAA